MEDKHSEIYRLALQRTKLSDEIKKLNIELLEIKKRYRVKWSQFRAECTSDKQANMMWENSEDGIREMTIGFLAKALVSDKSDLKLKIEILQEESKNYY